MTSVLLGLVVFVVAIGAVIGFGAVLHWGRHRDIGLLPYIFYPVVHTTLWQVLGSGRNLYSSISSELTGTVVALPPFVIWASRLASLYIVVSASERLINRLLHYGRTPKSPVMLSVAFIFFFLTTVLLSAFFGAHQSLSHEYFYLFLGGIAALLFTEAEGDVAIRSARTSLMWCLLLSALFLLINPQLVLSINYNEGLIPGLTVRYFGLTSHANTLGPLTVVFLLCLWSRPYSRVWLNRLAWFIGIATLIAAQSKTSWICFLLSMPCLVYFRYGAFLKGYFFDFRRPILLVTFLSLAMVFVTAIALIIMFGPTGNPLSSFFVTQAGADLMSMTGRNEIWAVAVREWNRNPLFGYGLTIWNDAHRARIGIPAAVTAHSQFYQTLASAGIVGVVGLFVYVLTLFWFVMKTVRVSQGLTLAFFLMLLFRSVSEVPLTMVGYYGPSELTHILILMVIASHFSALHKDEANSKVPILVSKERA